MKAIIKKEAKPGLSLEDAPIPEIQDHEVLIKIKKTSICGTDIHIDLWDDWAQKNIPVPLIIGHEFMGIIEKVGKNVKSAKEGDRVTGEGHLTCGQCPPCKQGKKHLCMNTVGVGVHTNGCFAEYLALPEENVFVLPEFVKDEIAAIFDPFGNAVHTALSFNLAAEDVLITGAGPIGIMAAAIAQKAGARNVVITDINDYRLNLAKELGATTVVNVGKLPIENVMKTIGIEHGFTVGLEMSGAPAAFNSILETAQPGANVALLGILPPETNIDWDLVIFKMLQIKGIYGREIFGTWIQMVNLIESGLDLDPLITHRFSADDFAKGFEIMRSGNCGKVILEW